MNVTHHNISVRDLFDGYVSSERSGTRAYHGLLNVRPPYQREFIYTPKQEQEVMYSVMAKFPLNTIYWSVCKDGTYELLDGQQRTMSILRYCVGAYAISYDSKKKFWHNLTHEQFEDILNYELDVYFCDGTEEEKLKWFQIINIAGEKLTQQELLNAVYHGPWVNAAKEYFVKLGSKGPAADVSRDFVSVSIERQGLLETAIEWISPGDVAGYMAKNQHEKSALELWKYFRDVIDWAKELFPGKYREKKHVNWGELYRLYGQNKYDPDEITRKVDELMANSEVQSKSGIFRYVLSGEEKHLNLRQFAASDKRSKWAEQGGKCALCGKEVVYEECEADHIIPWSKGGRTDWDNLQVLCRDCNRTKSGK